MKASFTLQSAIDKAVQIAVLIPAAIWIMNPYVAQAHMSLNSSGEATQVFEVKNLPTQNSENTDQTTSNQSQPSLAYDLVAANDIDYQTKLAYKQELYDYLSQRGSPLADCVDVLVELKNSDKIMSLANAESSLGKFYIRDTANMWGVNGGYSKMGDTVCEGVVSMNSFLDNFPKRSTVKYADMTFAQMDGLYKQPKAIHWENNNLKIIHDLEVLKARAHDTAQAKIDGSHAAVIATTAETELLKK